MAVARYTTPTFQLVFTEDGLDLTQAESVYVTFEQGKTKITKTGTDLTVREKQISIWMSQEETAKFKTGVVDVQANWMIAGNRVASDIMRVNISGQLLTEVIT